MSGIFWKHPTKIRRQRTSQKLVGNGRNRRDPPQKSPEPCRPFEVPATGLIDLGTLEERSIDIDPFHVFVVSLVTIHRQTIRFKQTYQLMILSYEYISHSQLILSLRYCRARINHAGYYAEVFVIYKMVKLMCCHRDWRKFMREILFSDVYVLIFRKLFWFWFFARAVAILICFIPEIAFLCSTDWPCAHPHLQDTARGFSLANSTCIWKTR